MSDVYAVRLAMVYSDYCGLLKSLNQPNATADSFILMKEFEQESHKRASQNRARRPFEL